MTINNSQDEYEAIQKIANHTGYLDRCMEHSLRYSKKILRKYLAATKSVLEVGPAEGFITDFLYKHSGSLEIIEPSELFSDSLKTRFPAAKVNNCMLEDYKSSRKFDTIIISHVLEHIVNPVYALKLIKNLLSEDGITICIVPNSNSLHRSAAVAMGLLAANSSLNHSDIQHGHKRVYNPGLLADHFMNAELHIIDSGGYWIKPLSNSQINSTWTDQMIEAFMDLGAKYPEISAEIFVVASSCKIKSRP